MIAASQSKSSIRVYYTDTYYVILVYCIASFMANGSSCPIWLRLYQYYFGSDGKVCHALIL